MPIDVLAGFVDRRDELALFHRMLRGEIDKRVLLLFERAEQGKTCFLLKLAHECETSDPPVPVVLLDFDQRRSGLADYAGVGREVCASLGDERAPALCACQGAGRAQPGVDAGVSFRRSLQENLVGQFSKEELLTLSHVLGEDYEALPGQDKPAIARELVLHFQRRGRLDALLEEIERQRPLVAWPESPQAQGPPAGSQVKPSEEQVGRALRDDLAALAEMSPRVVVLIDTFEQANEETCAWLERWLLDPLRRELRHVVVVVAGRPECRDRFSSAPRWGYLAQTVHRFGPLDDDDILDHYRLRGLAVSTADVALFQIARMGPAKMAQVGDLLQQAQGGRR